MQQQPTLRRAARNAFKALIRTAGCFFALAAFASCAQDEAAVAPPNAQERPEVDATESMLAREINRIDQAAASIDSLFQPLPLLSPREEEVLRTYLSGSQLPRARALGVGRNRTVAELDSLREAGELVLLEDSEYWVVRDLGYSRPLAVPGVRTRLIEIGEKFHQRLDALGAPPFRFEVSSVLRSADDQQALRQINPNAAVGESTHEYGTTVDVLYSAFSAPLEPIVEPDVAAAPWLETYLERYAEVAAERVGGRRALELKAILGQVLIEEQREGDVMVTLERRQPVFHMTLAAEP